MNRLIARGRQRLLERYRLASARAAIRGANRRIARRRRLARPSGYRELVHPLVLLVIALAIAATWAA